MAEPIPITATGEHDARTLTGSNEAALRAEIAFWQEMLETCGSNTPRESRERMGFALALAKKRLNTLFENYCPSGRTGESPPNVFHLDRQRR